VQRDRPAPCSPGAASAGRVGSRSDGPPRVSVGRSVDAAAGAQHAAPVDDPYRLQRFVFPQVAGLGTSGMSRTYAVSGLAEELRSSMTLFARAAPEEPVFAEVIARWFDGAADAATTSRR
jgi:hypothetical protein